MDHAGVPLVFAVTLLRYSFSLIEIKRLDSLMFSRLSQVARHLSRPVPHFAHSSAARFGAPSITSSIMAATTPQQKGLIHTAACLIIGDEVLGGKVC
jgi:hypothetical protein